MGLADEIRGFFSGTDEPKTVEGIRERRRKIRERIEELEAEVQRLDSPEGRRKLIAGAEDPEAIGRRKRQMRDELEGLRTKEAELGDELDPLLFRERREETEEDMAEIPDQIERLKRGTALRDDARSRLRDLLQAIIQSAAHLERRADLDIRFSPATFRALEAVQDDIPGNFGASLKKLRPPPEDAPDAKRVVVYEVRRGRRIFKGDWTKEQLRDAGFGSVRHEGALPDVHVPAEEG